MNATNDTSDAAATEDAKATKPKLTLDVKIEKPNACKRHITVAVSREDINRYLDEAFSELVPKAEVRGFRPGKAPRKLVEHQFKEQVQDQVKGTLLLECLQQLDEEHEFSAISEPDIDLRKVELGDDGPMVFEFDLEVRPEFELPSWRGLKLKRMTYEVTDEDVERRLAQLLRSRSRLVPVTGPAKAEDVVVVRIVSRHGDEQLHVIEEHPIRIRQSVSFEDATVEDFDQLMIGVQAGEKRVAKCTLSDEAAREDLRGQQIDVEFEVLEVKRQELPMLSAAFLRDLGFADEDELREYVRRDLERRFHYQQQQALRRQVTEQLTANADWDLPEDLLRRHAKRELERTVLELQASGFSADEIQAHANQLRQNTLASTARALREHFILERIAEELEIEPTEEDYNLAITHLAMARGESPRKVRARLEKRGQMDSLRNQIIEDRVLDQIMANAEFTDEPYSPQEESVSPVPLPLSSPPAAEAIPEATSADAEELRQPPERD